jgi:hypothetical protein
MQDGKAVTARSSGLAIVGIGSSPGGSIYVHSILLNLIIKTVQSNSYLQTSKTKQKQHKRDFCNLYKGTEDPNEFTIMTRERN